MGCAECRRRNMNKEDGVFDGKEDMERSEGANDEEKDEGPH
jgi:hypothetical protein